MKTPALLIVPLLGLVAGCASHTSEERASIVHDVRWRTSDVIAKATTDVVKPADKVAIRFEKGDQAWHYTSAPEIWENIFVGDATAPAKIVIVDERPTETYENFAFTVRLRYSVTVALTLNGQIHILTGEADASIVLDGSAKTSREIMERAMLSIARQARVYLGAPTA